MATDAIVARLEELGAHRVFLRMAKQGQLLAVRCEMPSCYCPKGRKHFDKKAHPPKKWGLSVDHYPRLERDRGKLRPDNVRLAHVLCNNRAFGWRTKITTMLGDNKSLEEIAESLNRKKVAPPHGTPRWSASLVRKAFIS